MKRFTLLFLLAGQILYGQDLKYTELRTKIKEVTVFLQGAQLTREGNISLKKGKTRLKIKKLSPYLDEKSLEISGDGDFTILSVNHTLNYLENQNGDGDTKPLRDKVEALQLEKSYKQAELEVLREKAQLLEVNKKLGYGEQGSDLNQLKETVAYYTQEISVIKKTEIKLKQEIAQINQEEKLLENELRELKEEPEQPSSEIVIEVSTEQNTEAKLYAKYLVSNAGWFPKYDVRVEDVQSPVQLTYKAEVFQQCGEDWKQVKLKFSNVDPRKSGSAPSLKPWQLTYARLTRPQDLAVWKYEGGTITGVVRGEGGNPLVGATVVIQGSTVGTLTNAQGEFDLSIPEGSTSFMVSYLGYEQQVVPVEGGYVNVQMQDANVSLDEVVVTGYSNSGLAGAASGVRAKKERRDEYYPAGESLIREQKAKTNPLQTAIIENQTHVEFEVKVPYTLNSDGEKRRVDLQTLPIEAIYEYKAVPKIDLDAFLVARLVNWDQKQLLEGEANLYMEGTYVGRTILQANVLSDTLDLSLGRDKGILIEREEIEEFKQSRALGTNQVDTRAFRFQIKNKRSEPINIKIYDQVPLPLLNQIDVKVKDISGAYHNLEKGELRWDVELKPLEQKEWKLEYEVKYPKKERIYLE